MGRQTTRWLLIAQFAILTSATASSQPVSSPTPSEELENVSVLDCLEACDVALRELTIEAATIKDDAVTEAIAAERRRAEPIIAGLGAERDALREQVARTWLTAGIVGGVLLLAGLVAGLLLPG